MGRDGKQIQTLLVVLIVILIGCKGVFEVFLFFFFCGDGLLCSLP
jgi:hypothetical protein